MRAQHENETAVVTIGYAARLDGRGAAYAALGSGEGSNVLRVPFSLQLKPALCGRDVTYAAVNAVAEALLAGNLRNVVLRVADERLATDLAERRTLPVPLTLPYVALRCRLNRFASARVERVANGADRDLTGRARAEVSLDIAA